MLAALGGRIDAWTLWRRRPAGDGGFWRSVAAFVMRRPIAVAASATALLLVLGVPFLSVRFGLADERALPAELSSRRVHDAIRTRFASEELTAMVVVAEADPDARGDELARYAEQLSGLSGVARVETATGTYAHGEPIAPPSLLSLRFRGGAAAWLSVVPAADPLSPAGEALARAVRAAAAPFPVLVGGPSARLVDDKAALARHAPLAIAWICAVTFGVLLMMTRSVLVPFKALVLGALSLTATFGAMVWIFQQGHLAGVLGFTATGALETTTPLLMLCIAFGLSMDYEVFLLARIREEYDRTGDDRAAVVTGLQRTGGIITAASGILAAVFVAFATSGISLVKLFGVGLALAILIDATIIRALLVPAFMRLMGRANWWAPRWLRRRDRSRRSRGADPP
jgi:RND superfamily putative drug exporter